MQKSKKATIFVILLILAYSLLGNLKLVIEINKIYLYIINPIFWIGMAIILKNLIPKMYEKQKIKKEIISYIIIAALSYIVAYILSGIFISFGKNPFATTVKGYLINMWITMSVIIAREYIRYKLINNVYDNDKVLVAILISVVYVIMDLQLNRFFTSEKISMLMIIKLIAQVLLPSMAKNTLFSYIVMYSNWFPAVLYEFMINTYTWTLPILPNSPWIITVVIESMIPLIVFLYTRYTILRNELFKSREKLINSDPRNIIALVVVVVLATWFAVGIFPIAPIAIATPSMSPEINVGDVAIIRKCNSNDVIVGDVIQYKMEGYTVVHRVIEKSQSNGEVTFITQGDNNNSPDFYPVSQEQLIGKVIYKIKHIGYPAIWLHLIQEQKELEVETGSK